jgi:molybdate transport system substrate-binding protein
VTRVFALLSACALLALGCGGRSDSDSVTVFAASSLTDVLEDVARAFEAEHGSVELNFAGSATLREQILEGAKADVFIAANETILIELVQVGVVSAPLVSIATNRLVLAVTAGNPANVRSLDELSNPELLVGLCAEGVPCGDLAARLLDEAGVSASVDTFEPNVRALLGKVEIGELDVALVYATDVIESAEAEVADSLSSTSLTTSYVAAALAPEHEADDDFIAFLHGSEAQQLFADAGFEAP